jgi:hypothetical protein
MSKLLLDSQPLVVIPELAVRIGLNEAIILQQIHYWTEINRRAERNFKDGHHWTFNTYENWQKQFPFWAVDTIKRTITRLEKLELIISGHFNEYQRDRTKWYRVNYPHLQSMYLVSGNGQGKMPSCIRAKCNNGMNKGREGRLDPETPLNGSPENLDDLAFKIRLVNAIESEANPLIGF